MKTTRHTLIVVLFCFCLSAFLSKCVFAQYGNGIIDTYAGKGNPPADPGITSRDVVVDAAGNIYFSSPSKYTVYKISAGTLVPVPFAGTGAYGNSGDGGQATNAKIGRVYITVDATGNVYISDYDYGIIRKVTVSTGIITKIAGTGAYSSTGDGGPALSATFMSCEGLTADAAGNIYIADYDAQRIRKITAATGIISTVAGNGTAGLSGDGGLATSAAIKNPTNVSVDAAGNLYISCSGNYRIRKVTKATGIISTVAGTAGGPSAGDGGLATAATFLLPGWVTVDASGNMYISDGNRIRKVTAATGKINTIAGNGITGCYGDGGLAINARIASPLGIAVSSTGVLYLTQGQFQPLRMIDQSTGIIKMGCYIQPGLPYSDIGDGGPATSAQLNAPRDVEVDASGNIYIADGLNQRIRRVDANTHIIQTIAGGGDVGFFGDAGPAIYAMFNDPAGTCMDNLGNLYIADRYNNRIRKIDYSTGIITSVAGSGTAGFSGFGGPATSANIDRPQDVLADAAGNLFISSTYNNAIFKVAAGTGIITVYAGTGTAGFSGDGGLATAAQLNTVHGICFDASGNLIICDKANNRLRKVDKTTNIITTIAGTGVSGSTGDAGAAVAAKIYWPDDVALDPLGNLVIATPGSNNVRLLEYGSNNIYTDAGNGIAGFSGDGGPAINAELNFVSGMAIVPGDGSVFIADGLNHRIRFFTAPYIIPVPLKLLTFEANRKDNNALLHWTTASEDGTQYFQVERSEDGILFNSIGTVPAVGDNGKPNDYSFDDPLSNTNAVLVYYRLRMVDADGKYAYSNVVVLRLDGSVTLKSCTIYPNPFTSRINLTITSDKETSVIIRINGENGQRLINRIVTIQKGENSIVLDDLDNLRADIVLIEIISGKEKITRKIIKSH